MAFRLVLLIARVVIIEIVAGVENTAAHVPLLTCVLNSVAWLIFVTSNPLVVCGMSVMATLKLSVDDCHLRMSPVFPVSINWVEFMPAGTLVAPVIDPLTVVGCTVATTGTRKAEAHPLDAT